MGRISEWWRCFLDRRKAKKADDRKRLLEETAEDLFDVGITHEAMWLFYDGNPVCPMNMFKDGDLAPIVIGLLRKYYIENSK